MNCPFIRNSAIYFNFLTAQQAAKGFITSANDFSEKDITGNEIGKFDFSIIDFRSVNGTAANYTDNDFAAMADVQQILDWVKTTEQVPDFGEGYIIEKIYPLTENPELAGVESNELYPLAKYFFKIRIEYIKII